MDFFKKVEPFLKTFAMVVVGAAATGAVHALTTGGLNEKSLLTGAVGGALTGIAHLMQSPVQSEGQKD
jgi:hypothetical protein